MWHVNVYMNTYVFQYMHASMILGFCTSVHVARIHVDMHTQMFFHICTKHTQNLKSNAPHFFSAWRVLCYPVRSKACLRDESNCCMRTYWLGGGFCKPSSGRSGAQDLRHAVRQCFVRYGQFRRRRLCRLYGAGTALCSAKPTRPIKKRHDLTRMP